MNKLIGILLLSIFFVSVACSGNDNASITPENTTENNNHTDSITINTQ